MPSRLLSSAKLWLTVEMCGAAAICIAASFGTPSPRQTGATAQAGAASTQAIDTAASGINLTAMDTSVSPCQDFYQFACGRWNANNPIPADQSSWGTFQELAEKNRAELHQILERAARDTSGRDRITQESGDYYAACMNTAAVDQAGYQPIEPQLKAINGLQNKQQMGALVAQLQIHGVNALFGFGSDQDFKNANEMIAEADQGGLALPDRDYYLKTDSKSVALRKDYAAHVQKMFELLGDAPERAAAESQTVLRIETALARPSMSKVERRNPLQLYHKMSDAQFTALSPTFNWDAFFQGTGAPPFRTMNVVVPGFFKALNQEIERVPLNDWKTYLRWELVHAAAASLSEPFVDANFAFFGTELTGQQQIKPRWERCVASTDRQIGFALGQLYVEKHFSPQAKAHMQSMVHQLETALGQDIQALPWMTDPTRKQALVKLAAIVNKIGYPEKWRDYSSVDITRDNFYGNVERTNAFEWHRELNKIGKPIDRNDWDMTPPTVNAYYNPEWNEIVFPAGILQPPFFGEHRDLASNYGGAGMVIGHELTHGFDDEGRHFDAHGNMRDWWTPADAKAFEARTACLVDEYGGFSPLPGVKLNGKLTLGENTADNGGARIALAALETALAGNGKTEDGYTPVQRFFISFGQVFCENVRPERARMLALVDPHSPGRFRVNGVVTNMQAFAQAFHCGPQQPMTAGPKACRVW